MDLGDLLLVLLFLVFPLLQHLLDRRAGPRPPEGAEEEEIRDLPPLEAEARPSPLPGLEPASGPARPVSWEEWSAGAEEAEALAGREVLDEEAAAELAARLERLPAEVVPEAVRVSAPVISLEPLHVHRPAKRARAEAAPAPPPIRPRPAAGLPALLRGRGQLRRAVVLSEVLGPPKSLQ